MEIVGIYGGLTFGILGWFFGREAARKKGGLDEMHTHIWRMARSTSWYITIAAIYVLMTLSLSGVHLNLIPALSILLFVQCSSWAISGFIFSARLTEPTSSLKPSVILFTMIGVSFLMLFVIISLLTNEWRFLFAAIPPIVLNLAIVLAVNKKRSSK